VSNHFIMLLIWNLIVMLLYGLDKLCAKAGARRIRESYLLASAFCFGAVGAMFGMVVFNHKTSKPKFRILVPLAALFVLIEVFCHIKTILL